MVCDCPSITTGQSRTAAQLQLQMLLQESQRLTGERPGVAAAAVIFQHP